MTGGEKTLDMSTPPCPLCGGPGRPFRSFGDFELPECSSCGSLYYVPPPEETVTDGDRPWESTKWYVERGANLLFYAEIVSLVRSLLRARPGGGERRPCRVLEAGGSYGFLIDIGRVNHGWEIAAADPGSCARRGSLDLSIPLYGGRAENADFDSPLDAVIGVQLIEHLHDPFAFAEALAGLLDPSGILLLTTPDASFDDLGPDYHPGEHVILFSRQGLEKVLRRAGFRHFGRYSLSLSQMLVLAASAETGPAREAESVSPPGEPWKDVEKYIRTRLASKDLPDYLRGGLLFRLFEGLVNAGRYGEAEALQGELEVLMGRATGREGPSFFEILVERMAGAADHTGYEGRGPGYTAPYLLYSGILALNHRGDREEAATLLALAEKLFHHEIGRLGLTQYGPFLSAAQSARKIAGGGRP